MPVERRRLYSWHTHLSAVFYTHKQGSALSHTCISYLLSCLCCIVWDFGITFDLIFFIFCGPTILFVLQNIALLGDSDAGVDKCEDKTSCWLCCILCILLILFRQTVYIGENFFAFLQYTRLYRLPCWRNGSCLQC